MRKEYNRHDFRNSHALVQSFILNEELLDELASLSCIENHDIVLEIGPGMGGLTCELAKRAKRVFAVEADERLRPYLELSLSKYNNISICFADVLKLNLRDEIESRYGIVDSLRVAANLPYYITSELIQKLTRELPDARTMALMVQKEVAEKMIAVPGNAGYGPLSLLLQWQYDVQIVRSIPRTEFEPAPKVDSAFVLLKKKIEKQSSTIDEEHLFKLIRSAFLQKRKTLCNSLAAAGYDKDLCKQTLDKLNIDPHARAEELYLNDYCRFLSNYQKSCQGVGT